MELMEILDDIEKVSFYAKDKEDNINTNRIFINKNNIRYC